MTAAQEPDTEQLLTRAAAGDASARGELLQRYRQRLHALIALRLDRRLAARVDPSDVIQETLTKAAQQLSDYLKRRPLPFYPWLRQLALDKLIDESRRHIHAQRRSVQREQGPLGALPDGSVLELAQRLFSPGSSPSARLRRAELAEQVQAALRQLPERDRELLVLRHLEQLQPREIAAILGLSEGAVYTRYLRAVRRLQDLLSDYLEGEAP
jgi:RNA polymerase sigma-70 factor (ECF subfamily)